MLSDRTVGVLGSGEARHQELAEQVGRLVADFQVNLLTGGGAGVMEAVSAAFVAARRDRGICIGIIPCSESDRRVPKAGYPNAHVELAIYTHLPYSGIRGEDDLSRNHINVLSSDVLIALPGGSGTAAEVTLAVRYGKPVIVFSPDAHLVAHFRQDVARARALTEVAEFLGSWISRRHGISGE
jgi:uncharacterized protein (TIGR00725 family)